MPMPFDDLPKQPLPVTLKPRWSFGTWAAMAIMAALGAMLAFATAPDEWQQGNRAEAVFAGLCALTIFAMVGAGLAGRMMGLPQLTIAPGRVEFRGLFKRGVAVDLTAYAPAVLLHRSTRAAYLQVLQFVPRNPSQRGRKMTIKPFAPNKRAAEAVLLLVRRAGGDDAPIGQGQENHPQPFACKPTQLFLLALLICGPLALGAGIWLHN